MNAHMQQVMIHFSGVVQGVGFRYNTHHYAAALGLKGWVRNLPDGRVEACVQGNREDIEQLCENLKRHYDGSIRGVDVSHQALTDAFEDFRIVR